MKPRIVIIGGGLAGISAALELESSGADYLLLEQCDQLGGRMQTDFVDGYALDRGFQVILSGYPSVQEFGLVANSRSFDSGALIYHAGRVHKIYDPFRHPVKSLKHVWPSFGTLKDRLLTLKLRYEVDKKTIDDLFREPEVTTQFYLEQFGFSREWIAVFMRPFFSGIFLEPHLTTSHRMFLFVFKMFSTGSATLPPKGVGAWPAMLASRLSRGRIRTNARVVKISKNEIELENKELIQFDELITTQRPHDLKILPQSSKIEPGPSAHTYYFSADRPPFNERLLFLNGDQTKPINHVAVLTNVQPTYSQKKTALISVNIVDPTADHSESICRDQLTKWFGNQVSQWSFLKYYKISHALPNQSSVRLSKNQSFIETDTGVIAGDGFSNGSQEAALTSGRSAAQSILQRVGS